MGLDPGIQGAGWMGVALEETPGVFEAPTKFIPFLSESMSANQQTVWRRTIRGLVDPQGAVFGNTAIGGDIKLEALHDAIVYFLHAARTSVVKSGTTPDFSYVFTPNNVAVVPAGRTLSIMIVRNEEVFVYRGCTVGQEVWGIENGAGVVTFSLIGMEEDAETVAVPTFSTTEPFGAGQYDIKIPASGAAVLDTDSFTFTVNNNGTAEYRLRSGGHRGPTFQKFGERNVSMAVVRDFRTRAEYEEYKLLTAKGVSVEQIQSATRSVKLLVPRAISDTYEVSGLGSQGELVRANISYNGVYDPTTSKSYEITVKTSESIVLV